MKRVKQRAHRVLRQLEPYTQTDMVYLATGSFWIILGRVFGSGASFLLTLLLAQQLTAETFGAYKYIQSLAGVITAFSLSGMSTAISRAVARGESSALLAGYKIFMRWSPLMSLISCGMALYYFNNENTLYGWSLLIVSATVPLAQGGGFYSAYLNGKRDFRKDTLYGLAASVLPIVTLGITAYFFTTLPILVLSFYGASAAISTILYLKVARNVPRSTAGDEKTLQYGKHLSALNIFSMISTQADRLLVFHYLGAAQLAAYTIALAAPQQLRIGSKILAQIYLPKFSVAPTTALYKTLPRKAFVVFLVSVPIVLGYIVLAPLFFKFFFPAYMDAILYSQIFSLVILFFPATLFQQFFVGQMKRRTLYALNISVPFVKIILLFLLLPRYGVLGALSAILGMELFRLLAALGIFKILAHRHNVAATA